MTQPYNTELLVACLCAEWCKTCREYRAGFEALSQHYPQAAFHWVDVEDEADWLGDVDVETFPTVLVQRGETVLFFGPLLPQHGRLQRMLATLAAFTEDEARAYVEGHPERLAWQSDVKHLGEALERHRGA